MFLIKHNQQLTLINNLKLIKLVVAETYKTPFINSIK